VKRKPKPDATVYLNDSLRYVAPNSKQVRLLAFDATQQGKGFGFGDGKTDRYYVEGWKSKEQNLNWNFRTAAAKDFKILIKYLAPAESSGGMYAVALDDFYQQQYVATDKKSTTVVTRELGTVRIQPGTHQLKISPLSFGSSELMKLLEVQLIPVATNALSPAKIIAEAEQQTKVMLVEIPKAKAAKSGATNGVTPGSAGSDLVSPRTLDSLQLKLVTSKDWTSGFFPGELWFLYEATGKKEWKEAAEKYTVNIEREKTNGGTHDMGFKIYCSFGQGYRLTKDAHYKEVIIQSAKTLSTRFNPVAGVIKSWDNKKWDYPVIIDNMMNLELLFAATKLTGDSSFYKIAFSHAATTMKNHFRSDYSSYHVVNYDTTTGKVIQRVTHQGYADESAWARGQAWGLYGFTMCYRETKNKAFLDQAEHIAAFIMKHPNLPNDKVPYWDFNAPNIPNEPRDASAAAVIASGLYELSLYSKSGKLYKNAADKIVESLTNYYRAPVGDAKGFILLHSTGSKPSNSEVDVPLSYADYYYLEALLRMKKINEGKKLF
jgi:rhamnogalacturonyl hydrolase YesR